MPYVRGIWYVTQEDAGAAESWFAAEEAQLAEDTAKYLAEQRHRDAERSAEAHARNLAGAVGYGCLPGER